MIIGIDASRANKKERTGVEWYSYFLIQEFKRLVPAETKVWLYMQEPPCEDFLPLPPNWEARVLPWPFRFWTIFRLSWEMLWRKPDVFFSPANILPFFAPKKTFTTIHDIGFKRFPDCYGVFEKIIQNFGTRRAIKKSDKIFVPSEFTKKELIDAYGAGAEKIVITPLSSTAKSVAVATLLAGEILEKYKIKKPYFLYIGRKEDKKNTPRLVEAFKIFNQKNPEYSLVLAGPNKISDITYQMSNVKSIDWIGTEEKLILLQNCEAFVFPSLYEGFGLPILEAFAAEAPVITSGAASMPEVARDAAVFVDPQDAHDIAAAMEKIAKNSGLRQELAQKGKNRLADFSWEKCAGKTLEIMLQKKRE